MNTEAIAFQKKMIEKWEASVRRRDFSEVSPRCDAQASYFVQHLLISTLSEIIKSVYPEMKFLNGGLIPWDFSGGSSLLLGWHERDVKDADGDGIITHDATDIPLTDVSGAFHASHVAEIAEAYSYTEREMELANEQGLGSIVGDKASATSESMDRKLERLVRQGSNNGSIKGIYDSCGTFADAAAPWELGTTTPEELKADIGTAISSYVAGTGGGGEWLPDTCVMSWDRMNVLAQTTNGTNTDKSVLEYLQSNYKYITRWETERGAATGGESGGECALLYKNNKSVLRARLPMRMKPMAPEIRGMRTTVALRSLYGGIQVYKPREVMRLDGI